MSNKPRRHHFIPQFWIKEFVSVDGHLWGYRWDDDVVKRRSSKAVMQVFDLYTIQPCGVDDTSTETEELGKVDANGAIALRNVLSGDNSERAKTQLASLIAAQIMRDPSGLAAYAPRTQEYAIHLLDALNAGDFDQYSADHQKRFPGTTITKGEYDHIRSLGPTGAEQAVEAIVEALNAKGGMPELPFTDLINDTSGRDMICQVLIGMNWEIKTDPGNGFILGDFAVLFDKGSFQNGLRVPLSKSAALYLHPSRAPTTGITSSQAQPHEVEALNAESAARARNWLVGDKARIEELKRQMMGSGFPAI